jgi:Cdc6-like AAA superfamily ATPase
MPLTPNLVTPLSDDFKPPRLLFRDKQLQEIFRFATKNSLPENLWIEGEPGLGKTLTCRFFADEVEARSLGKVFYLNCERSIRKVMENLKITYNLPVAKKDVSPSTLAMAILREYQDADLIVFIIDEPEKAYSFKDVDAFVHTLYNTMLGKKDFSIIFASKILYTKARRLFHRDTLSRLQLHPIVFPMYDVPQIVEIVKQRLQYMFGAEEVYDVDALFKLGKHIRRIGSDIREALQILRYAITIADKKITSDVIEQAVEWGKNRWWQEQLQSLPPHWAYLLYLAAHQAYVNNSLVTTQPRVIRQYLNNMRIMKLDPLGRATIYYAFVKLAEKGYFQTKSEGKGLKRITKIVFDEGDRDHIVNVGSQIEWEYELGMKSI